MDDKLNKNLFRALPYFLIIGFITGLLLISCSPKSDSGSQPTNSQAAKPDEPAETKSVSEAQSPPAADGTSGAQSDSAQSETAAPSIEFDLPKGTQYITALTASKQEKLYYLLTVAPCKNNECPIQVHLARQNQIVDTLPLAWSSTSQEIQEFPLGYGYGAGDILDQTTQYPSWTVGSNENNNVSNILRTVKLSANVDALLVHQSTGFEHLHRHHAIYVVDNNKLKQVWSAGETSGPSWSTMLISKSSAEGSQQLIFLNGIKLSTSGVEDQFDELDISYLSWNNATHQLDSSKEPKGDIYAVVAFPFATTAKARLKLDTQNTCFGYVFDILPSSRFSQLKLDNKVVAVAVTQDKTKADELSKKISQCAPDMQLRVLHL